uniref:ATP synthase F0 subunit 8 n=1 Tax=Dictyopteris divaricata TaxID=156996 RepID=A0A4Y5T7U8_9PHAE|nr:ATP synthase F0 subunit 8 [Dictyopteris divaricata]QDB64135.1 ATP synthase F0 subunit 8 [Dictyopteris divaricata]
MPQFDISSFFNQVFWLSVFFAGFYLLVIGFLLPDVVSGIKARYKKEKIELLLDSRIIVTSNKTTIFVGLNKKFPGGEYNTGFHSAF